MDRLHKAIDRMCDKKGLDTRDHLHRALDQVLTARESKLGGTSTDDAVAKAHTLIHGNRGESIAPVGAEDVAFEETKHPRVDNGQFGSGSNIHTIHTTSGNADVKSAMESHIVALNAWREAKTSRAPKAEQARLKRDAEQTLASARAAAAKGKDSRYIGETLEESVGDAVRPVGDDVDGVSAKDLIKPPSIVMDSEGRCTLRPVGK